MCVFIMQYHSLEKPHVKCAAETACRLQSTAVEHVFPNRKHWDVSAKDHFVRVCERAEKMHSCRKCLVRNYRLGWKWLEVNGKV